MAEGGEKTGHRWRTMLWATSWMCFGTLVGGLLSGHLWIGLLATAIAASAAGLSGAASARSGVIGLLTLVVFIIYLGGPDTALSPWVAAGLTAIGGVLQALVMIVPYLIFEPKVVLAAYEKRPAYFPRIRTHIHWHNQYVDHAIRLSIAVTLATAIAQASGIKHQYWLPMTVAWVTQSGQLGTVRRVLSRILGTAAGLLVVVIFIDGFHAQGQWLVPLTTAAAGVAMVFVTSNYLISVLGTTTLIVTVLYMDGDKLGSTVPERLGETILAGIIAIIALSIWPDKKIVEAADQAPSASH